MHSLEAGAAMMRPAVDWVSAVDAPAPECHRQGPFSGSMGRGRRYSAEMRKKGREDPK